MAICISVCRGTGQLAQLQKLQIFLIHTGVDACLAVARQREDGFARLGGVTGVGGPRDHGGRRRRAQAQLIQPGRRQALGCQRLGHPGLRQCHFHPAGLVGIGLGRGCQQGRTACGVGALHLVKPRLRHKTLVQQIFGPPQFLLCLLVGGFSLLELLIADGTLNRLDLTNAQAGFGDGGFALLQGSLRLVIAQTNQHLAGCHQVAFTNVNMGDQGSALAGHVGPGRGGNAPAGDHGLHHRPLADHHHVNRYPPRGQAIGQQR